MNFLIDENSINKPFSEFASLSGSKMGPNQSFVNNKIMKVKNQQIQDQIVKPGTFYHGEQHQHLNRPAAYVAPVIPDNSEVVKNKYSRCDFLYYLMCPCKIRCCKTSKNGTSRSMYDKYQNFKYDESQFKQNRQDASILARIKEFQDSYDYYLAKNAEYLNKYHDDNQRNSKFEGKKQRGNQPKNLNLHAVMRL
jgi:hypothetical protein